LLYAGAVLLLGADDMELLMSVPVRDVPEYVVLASLLGLLVLYEGLVLILGLL